MLVETETVIRDNIKRKETSCYEINRQFSLPALSEGNCNRKSIDEKIIKVNFMY